MQKRRNETPFMARFLMTTDWQPAEYRPEAKLPIVFKTAPITAPVGFAGALSGAVLLEGPQAFLPPMAFVGFVGILGLIGLQRAG